MNVKENNCYSTEVNKTVVGKHDPPDKSDRPSSYIRLLGYHIVDTCVCHLNFGLTMPSCCAWTIDTWVYLSGE